MTLDYQNVLVTGAAGQIGSELTGVLRGIYGNDHVIAAGHVKRPGRELLARTVAGVLEAVPNATFTWVCEDSYHHQAKQLFDPSGSP